MQTRFVRVFCVSCGQPVAAVLDPQPANSASSSQYTYECHHCGYCGLIDMPVEETPDDSQQRGDASV